MYQSAFVYNYMNGESSLYLKILGVCLCINNFKLDCKLGFISCVLHILQAVLSFSISVMPFCIRRRLFDILRMGYSYANEWHIFHTISIQTSRSWNMDVPSGPDLSNGTSDFWKLSYCLDLPVCCRRLSSDYFTIVEFKKMCQHAPAEAIFSDWWNWMGSLNFWSAWD